MSQKHMEKWVVKESGQSFCLCTWTPRHRGNCEQLLSVLLDSQPPILLSTLSLWLLSSLNISRLLLNCSCIYFFFSILWLFLPKKFQVESPYGQQVKHIFWICSSFFRDTGFRGIICSNSCLFISLLMFMHFNQKWSKYFKLRGKI